MCFWSVDTGLLYSDETMKGIMHIENNNNLICHADGSNHDLKLQPNRDLERC